MLNYMNASIGLKVFHKELGYGSIIMCTHDLHDPFDCNARVLVKFEDARVCFATNYYGPGFEEIEAVTNHLDTRSNLEKVRDQIDNLTEVQCHKLLQLLAKL